MGIYEQKIETTIMSYIGVKLGEYNQEAVEIQGWLICAFGVGILGCWA